MPKLTSSHFDQSEKTGWVLKTKYSVPPSSHIQIRCPLIPTKRKYDKSKTP